MKNEKFKIKEHDQSNSKAFCKIRDDKCKGRSDQFKMDNGKQEMQHEKWGTIIEKWKLIIHDWDMRHHAWYNWSVNHMMKYNLKITIDYGLLTTNY